MGATEANGDLGKLRRDAGSTKVTAPKTERKNDLQSESLEDFVRFVWTETLFYGGAVTCWQE